ncbi:MAG: hypothetical protein J0L82_19505 [Deltaproteobacteria bacterium]|jgi:hypothetical protein|nr:hypothetical protein [Deltaproteobacteria bacterium]
MGLSRKLKDETGEQRHLKYETKHGFKTTRFKSSSQFIDDITKGWK